MIYTDTHCHIHEADYPDSEGAYQRAREAGVQQLICVGTDEQSSRQAVSFAQAHNQAWASVGLHPHDAKSGTHAVEVLAQLIEADKKDHVGKIVAVGECGLDYFYDNSPREMQLAMLEAQLDLAVSYGLPVIFHVRNGKDQTKPSVWDDFWPLFDAYKGLRGVLHSFTDNLQQLEEGLSRGLMVGVNGIATFARDENQQKMYRTIPLASLLLETDAPFLTPVPYRGTPNEPAYVRYVAEYLSRVRGESMQELSEATQQNAQRLFDL